MTKLKLRKKSKKPRKPQANRNTSGLKPPVRTTEEARALGKLGGRKPLPGGSVKVQIVLNKDQIRELRARDIKISTLARALINLWISQQPPVAIIEDEEIE